MQSIHEGVVGVNWDAGIGVFLLTGMLGLGFFANWDLGSSL